MRNFAIINIHDDVDFSENIIKKLSSEDKIYIFQDKERNFNISSNVECVKIPKEIVEYGSKVKNFVSKYFFDNNFNGFLHVIEDSVAINKNPTVFLDEIEKMMDKLDQKSWFNTITDICNYTFKIYNPRFSVCIDEPTVQKIYDKTIYWNSNANTSWICYDYSKATYEDIKFDESFKIPMFYIIKFLAERRNNKKTGELYYMNYYPTIEEERDVFKNVEVKDRFETTNEDMQNEGKLFESMHINHQADMIIEQVMDDVFNLLRTKT